MALITPSLAQIKRITESAWAQDFDNGTYRQWGVYNRRVIAGTSIWSQHAWGNAWDIGCSGVAGDRLAGWFRAELSVGTILWRVKDHFDHIHVEGLPKRTGIPPINTGAEEEMELIKHIQRALNAAGLTPPLKVDGVWGVQTHNRLATALSQGNAPTLPDNLIQSGDTVKITRA
jgi:hypothetical protein